MNPMEMMKIAQACQTFSANHPKFLPFVNAVSQGALVEGSVIEIAVTTPEGKKLESNLKLTQSDLEFLALMKSMMPKA